MGYFCDECGNEIEPAGLTVDQTMACPAHPRAGVSGRNTTDRFSRLAFGGGEAGEAAAHRALVAHEALLVPGTRVRICRGQPAGVVGTVVEGDAPGRRVYVREDDETGLGLRWEIETRNLEII